jgi:2-polyprenyl-3-methyl-5-hydroxy-6-metoxy-1,4-benzoquinol methylase
MEKSETIGVRFSSEITYLLDSAGREAPERFGALSAMFDVGTIRHLEDRGVGPGWHCLEVGGGGGSVANWLCSRVGPGGRVVVTDIDTRFLENLKLPNLEVLRHDLTRDPLAEAAYDLVHLRLVLVHLPDKEEILKRLGRSQARRLAYRRGIRHSICAARSDVKSRRGPLENACRHGTIDG